MSWYGDYNYYGRWTDSVDILAGGGILSSRFNEIEHSATGK
jgi:hypothetical protein